MGFRFDSDKTMSIRYFIKTEINFEKGFPLLHKTVLFSLIFILFLIPISEAKNYKAPYQIEKSAYFKKTGKTGYFRSQESAWYEKPWEWTQNGAKAIGNALKEIAGSL